jgi:hypothetical protein
MQIILEDIKRTLGATEVRLLDFRTNRVPAVHTNPQNIPEHPRLFGISAGDANRKTEKAEIEFEWDQDADVMRS